jgi:PAS domain S-box-containing protein
MNTFRSYLTAMVLAVTLPGAIYGMAAAYWIAIQLRDGLEQEATQLRDAITGNVAEHLRLLTTTMQVLGRSPSIEQGDYAAAYGFASRLAGDVGHHIGLAKPDGEQLFNTRRPYGDPLPRRSNAASYSRALSTGAPNVSNLIFGAIAQRPLVTVDIPVQGPTGPLVLGSSSDVDAIAAVLARTRLPEGWVSAVVDGAGQYIAHSRDQTRVPGSPAYAGIVSAVTSGQTMGIAHTRTADGDDIVAFYRAIPGTPWTGLIGVPMTVFKAPLRGPLALLAGSAASAALLTMFLAFGLGRRLDRGMRGLAEAVRLVGRGELPAPVNGFAEVKEVSLVARQVAEQLRDREQRLQAEARDRRASEERLRLFTEIVPAAIAMFDRDMRYIAASRRYAADYRVCWEDLQGRSHYEIFPELPERWKDIYRRCLAGASERRDEDTLVRSDGSVDWVSWEIRPWFDCAGQVGGVVLASEIISWRKQVENDLRDARDAAEQASASKARFFAAASHDLRQPLQAQRLFLEVLKPKLRPDQEVVFKHIDKAQDTVSELLGALLDMAKLDAGILMPQAVAVPAAQLIEAITAECAGRAEEKGLSLRRHAPRAPGYTVQTDRLMLERILRNLVTNAIRYTERGGVLLAARKRGQALRFEVWDTGIGIAPDRLELIWEEFYQVANSARDRALGLGLGLSIVQRLSRILDCPVGVRSRPGKGSVFWVDVPLAEPETALEDELAAAPAL